MVRRTLWVLSVLATLLGLAHLSIAAASFGQLSFQALWFIGAGVAIVVGGMLNLFALLATYGGGGRAVLGLANVALAGFFGLALTILPGPQVVVGLLLFAGLAGLAFVPAPRVA
jgi:hypothetical protein